MKYRITIQQDEDGVYVAEVPSLPGCISEGKTRKEALANIKDAIEGYLASLKKRREPIPPDYLTHRGACVLELGVSQVY